MPGYIRAPVIVALVVAGTAVATAASPACGDSEPDDEDLIERFIDELSGEVNDAYVQRTLAYVDLSVFPIDVSVPRHSGVYDEARGPELVRMYRQGMQRRFYGTQIRIRSRKYEITEDRAEVRLGLLTTVGLLRAEITLRKAGPAQWKVAKVHVRP